jgi:hypothetical protein
MEILPMIVLAAVMFAREFAYQHERREAARERAELLQRIQAPEAAVATFASGSPHEPVSGLPLMDDEYADLFHGD